MHKEREESNFMAKKLRMANLHTIYSKVEKQHMKRKKKLDFIGNEFDRVADVLTRKYRYINMMQLPGDLQEKYGQIQFDEPYKADSSGVMSVKAQSPSLQWGCERLCLVSATANNQLIQWQISDETIYQATSFDSDLTCMAYLPMSQLIATGHEDGCVYLWHFEVGINKQVEHGNFRHQNTVTYISVGRDEEKEFLLTAGYDGRVIIWEIIPQKFTKEFNAQAKAGIWFMPQLRGMIDISVRVGFQPHRYGDEILVTLLNENRVFIGGNNTRIEVWNFNQFDFIQSLEGHSDAVCLMQEKDNKLYSFSDDLNLIIWDMETLAEVSRVRFERQLRSLVSMQSAQNFVMADEEKVYIWSPEGGFLKEFPMEALINEVDFVDSHNLLLVALDNGEIVPIKVDPALGNPQGENLTHRSTDRSEIDKLLHEIMEIQDSNKK